MKITNLLWLFVIAVAWARPFVEEISHYDEAYGINIRVRNMEKRCFNTPQGITGLQVLSQYAHIDITGYSEEGCQGKTNSFPSGYYGFERVILFPSESISSVEIEFRYGDKTNPQDEFDVAWKWHFDDPNFFPLINEFDSGRTVNERFALLKCPNGRKEIALAVPPEEWRKEFPVYVSNVVAPSNIGLHRGKISRDDEGTTHDGYTYRGNVPVKDGILRIPINNKVENPIVFITIIGGSEMTLLSPLDDPLTPSIVLEDLEEKASIKQFEGSYGVCPIALRTLFDSSPSDNLTNIRSDGPVIPVREDETSTKSLFPTDDSANEIDMNSDSSYVLLWNSVRDLKPFRLTMVLTENVFRPDSVNSNTPIYFGANDNKQIIVSKNDLEKDFNTLCMKWIVEAEQNDLGPTAYCQIFSEILSAPIAWSPNRAMDDKQNVLSRICLHDNIPESSRFAMVICRPNGVESTLFLSEADLRTHFDGVTVQKQALIPVAAAQNHALLEDDRHYNGPYGPEDFVFVLIELSAPKMPTDLEFTFTGSSVCDSRDKCSHNIGYQLDSFFLIPKMVLANLFTDVLLDQESVLNILFNIVIELNEKVSGLNVELHVILNEDEDDRTRDVLTRDVETRKAITEEVIRNAGLFRPLEWTLESTRTDTSVSVTLEPGLNNYDDAHLVTVDDNLAPSEVVDNGRAGMSPGDISVFANPEFEGKYLFFVNSVSYWTDSDEPSYSAQMVMLPFDMQDLMFDYVTIDHDSTFKLNVPRVSGITVRYSYAQTESELYNSQFHELPVVNNKTFQKTIPAPFYGDGYVLLEIVDSLTGRSYRIVEEIHITEFDLSHQYAALPSNKVLRVPTGGKNWKSLTVAFDTEKPAREEDYSEGTADSEGNVLVINGISLVDFLRDKEVSLIIQHDWHNFWTVIGKPSIEFSDDNPFPEGALSFLYLNSYKELTIIIDTSFTPGPNVQVVVTTPDKCKKGEGLYPAGTHTLVKETDDQQLCIFSEYGAQSVPIPEAAVQNMEKIVIDYHLETTYPYSIEQGTVSGGITLADQDCVFDTLSSSPYTMTEVVSNTDYKFCYKIEEPSRRVTTTFWETARPNQFTFGDNHEFTTHTAFDVFSTKLSEDAPSDIEFGVGQYSPEMKTFSLSDRDSAKAYFSLIEHGLSTPNEKFAVCLKSDWQYWSLNGPVENLLDEEYHILELEKVSYNYVKNEIRTTLANDSVICENCGIGMSFEGECSGENVQLKRDFDAKETETFVWPVQMNEFLSNNTFICINDEEGDVQSIPLPPVHSTAFQDKTEEGIVTLVHETGTKSTISISASGHNNCNNVNHWPTQGTKEGGITTFTINETPVPVCARALKEIEGETTVETIFEKIIKYFNNHISKYGTYNLSHSDLAFTSDIFNPHKFGLVPATETCTIDSPVRDDAVVSFEAGKMIVTFDSLPHWEDENLGKLCIWQSQRNVVGVIVAYTNFSDPFYRFEVTVELYDVDDQHMKLIVKNINVMCPECVAWLGVSCTLGELEEMGTTPVPLPQSSYTHELTFEGVSYDSALGLCIKGDGIIRKMDLRMPTNDSFDVIWEENVVKAEFNHGIPTYLTSVEVDHGINLGDTVYIQNLNKVERESPVKPGQRFVPSPSNREISFSQSVMLGAKYAWILADNVSCASSAKDNVVSVTNDGETWKAGVDLRGMDGEITVCITNENYTNFVSVKGSRSKTLNSEDNAKVEAGKDFIVHYKEDGTVISVTDAGRDLLNNVMINGQKVDDDNNTVVLPDDTKEIQFSSTGSAAPITVDLPPKFVTDVLIHTQSDVITISILMSDNSVVSYGLNENCQSENQSHSQYASIQNNKAQVSINPEVIDRICFNHISLADQTISDIGTIDIPLVCPASAEAEVVNENELFVPIPLGMVGSKAFIVTDQKECSADKFHGVLQNTRSENRGVIISDSAFDSLKDGEELDICFQQSPNATALVTIKVNIDVPPAPPAEESSIFSKVGISSLITGGIGIFLVVILCACCGSETKKKDEKKLIAVPVSNVSTDEPEFASCEEDAIA